MSKSVKSHNELENVQNVLSTSEAFIEKYQKQILMGLGIIVLVVLAVLGFRNYYLQPREVNAENEMAKAQAYFAADSFKVALNGNKNVVGFKDIASDYSMTSSGNLASAYTGICYYKLGEYQNAVKYLSQYDGDDAYFKTSVIGLIGDAYVELGDKDKALDYFEKAAKSGNSVVSPVYLKKAGIVYEAQNKPEKALEMYQQIKDSYPKSNEAADIDKYIARVQK